MNTDSDSFSASRQIKQRIESFRQETARIFSASKFLGVLGIKTSQYQAEKLTEGTSLFQPTLQPAVEFEKKSGFTGIAKRYHLPAGLTTEDLEDYTCINWADVKSGRISEECAINNLRELAEALFDLNPELRGINFTPNEEKFRFLIDGIASGFDHTDIQFFLSDNHVNQPPNSEYKALRNKIEKILGGGLQWAPSVETLKKIEKQLFPEIQPAVSSSRKPFITTTAAPKSCPARGPGM